jgi:hypothetical protein
MGIVSVVQDHAIVVIIEREIGAISWIKGRPSNRINR